MNRGIKTISLTSRKDSDKNCKIESTVIEILKEIKDLKKNMVQYIFHMRMETVDI